MVRLVRTAYKPIALVLFLLLVGGLLWRNWNQFIAGISLVHTLPVSTIVYSCLLLGLSFILAATSYKALAFRRLAFAEVTLVEFAAAFATRIIPSGIGGLGVHGLYLHRRKHTVAQATAVISVNNLLTIAIHNALLLIALLYVGASLELRPRWNWLIPVVVGVVGGWLILRFVPQYKQTAMTFVKNVTASLLTYRRRPASIVAASIALTGLISVNVVMLWVVSTAYGVHLSALSLFIVYSAGVLVGTLVPTPGGLAGAEAGLVAGFIGYGVASDVAIAIALTYRFIVYWIPLLPGAAALLLARNRKLL